MVLPGEYLEASQISPTLLAMVAHRASMPCGNNKHFLRGSSSKKVSGRIKSNCRRGLLFATTPEGGGEGPIF